MPRRYTPELQPGRTRTSYESLKSKKSARFVLRFALAPSRLPSFVRLTRFISTPSFTDQPK